MKDRNEIYLKKQKTNSLTENGLGYTDTLKCLWRKKNNYLKGFAK